jgi:hypothetical protein
MRLKRAQNLIEGGEKSSPFFYCAILKLLRRRVQNMFKGGEKSPLFLFSRTALGS